MGYIKTVIWDSNNLFLAEKHSGEGGVINIKYVHIFRYFFSSIVIIYSKILINPNSLNAYRTEDNEKVFPESVN